MLSSGCRFVSTRGLEDTGAKDVVGSIGAAPSYRRMAELIPSVKPVVPMFG